VREKYGAELIGFNFRSKKIGFNLKIGIQVFFEEIKFQISN